MTPKRGPGEAQEGHPPTRCPPPLTTRKHTTCPRPKEADRGPQEAPRSFQKAAPEAFQQAPKKPRKSSGAGSGDRIGNDCMQAVRREAANKTYNIRGRLYPLLG
eukprot:9493604-Pyramimonas_sp.AAC.1